MTIPLETAMTVRPYDLKRHYDGVIIGGGGHGVATAYYLMKYHALPTGLFS
ncbi:hypothetical protein P4S70_15540 [Enterovibrio sp. Hal110]